MATPTHMWTLIKLRHDHRKTTSANLRIRTYADRPLTDDTRSCSANNVTWRLKFQLISWLFIHGRIQSPDHRCQLCCYTGMVRRCRDKLPVSICRILVRIARTTCRCSWVDTRTSRHCGRCLPDQWPWQCPAWRLTDWRSTSTNNHQCMINNIVKNTNKIRLSQFQKMFPTFQSLYHHCHEVDGLVQQF